MFAKFFIDRPVFAWVIAIAILLAGALALKNLPVSQYPSVAPPALDISVVYPGASSRVVEETAIALIEQEMNGIENLLYMDSASQIGTGTVTLTFKSRPPTWRARFARRTCRFPPASLASCRRRRGRS